MIFRSILFYSIFYTLLKFINLPKFNKINNTKFVSRINSSINAVIIIISCSLYLLNIIEYKNWNSSLDVMRGYLIYDTTLLIYYNNEKNSRLMILHHLLLFMGTYSSFLGIYPRVVAIGLLSEITNMFLYFGWYLMKTNRKHTQLFLNNGILLLILFFVFRVCNFFYVWRFAVNNCGYIDKIITFIIWILNVYWFFLLIYQLYKRLLIKRN